MPCFYAFSEPRLHVQVTEASNHNQSDYLSPSFTLFTHYALRVQGASILCYRTSYSFAFLKRMRKVQVQLIGFKRLRKWKLCPIKGRIALLFSCYNSED